MKKLPVASLLKKIVSIIIPKCLIHSYPTPTLDSTPKIPMNIGNGGVNINLASLGKNPSWCHHPPTFHTQGVPNAYVVQKELPELPLLHLLDGRRRGRHPTGDDVDVGKSHCGTLTCKKYHKRKPPTPPHLELIQVDPKGRSEKSNPNWNPELGV